MCSVDTVLGSLHVVIITETLVEWLLQYTVSRCYYDEETEEQRR